MAVKKKIARQVRAKAKKASTYAALSGLLGGLALIFPQYGAALQGAALVAASVGTVLPDPLAAKANAEEAP